MKATLRENQIQYKALWTLIALEVTEYICE